MRQVRKTSSGNGVLGGFPKEGMSEGPAGRGKTFSKEEIACLKNRRAKLILEGKKDNTMGEILAVEMGRPAYSITAKICRLIKSGELGENPNKKEEKIFTEEEIACIKKRRAELALEGKTDNAIADVLAREMKRTAKSTVVKIRRLIESGELTENPNKRYESSKKDIAKLKKRRAELILEGKNDGQIAKVLAKEMERPVGSIREKIRELVESGELEENPGKKELQYFSKEDVAYMKKKRVDLILEGKTDRQIARVLAGEMNRTAGSIEQKIRRLVESCELEENPNKKGRRLSEDELATELSAAVDIYLGDPP